MPMIGARFYAQLDNVQTYADELELELAKEMDNGRICRLLSKLGTINERPEYALVFFFNECLSILKTVNFNYLSVQVESWS